MGERRKKGGNKDVFRMKCAVAKWQICGLEFVLPGIFSKINWLHGRGPIWQWSPPYIASHRNCISLRDLSKFWNNFTSSDPYRPAVCFFLWDNLTCAHPCHILLAFSLTLYLAFFSFIFPRIFATIWHFHSAVYPMLQTLFWRSIWQSS